LWTIVLVAILDAVFLMAACTKKVMQTESAATFEPQSQVVSEVPQAAEEHTVEVAQPAHASPQPQSETQAESVVAETAHAPFSIENIHFAFDSSEISYQDQMLLTRKADYLRTNPSVSLTIEGYCDERGTQAYNLDLGARRAEAAKDLLVRLGISADRVNTVSYGEEYPVDAGHDEAAWAKNRRAQFMID